MFPFAFLVGLIVQVPEFEGAEDGSRRRIAEGGLSSSGSLVRDDDDEKRTPLPFPSSHDGSDADASTTGTKHRTN